MKGYRTFSVSIIELQMKYKTILKETVQQLKCEKM